MLDESDRLMLLRVFESMLGLPGGFLVPEERAANRSLTAAEAELVRLLNSEFSRRGWPHRDYARFMRYGAVEHMKDARRPSPDEPKIATPAWALARAAEISAEMAGRHRGARREHRRRHLLAGQTTRRRIGPSPGGPA